MHCIVLLKIVQKESKYGIGNLIYKVSTSLKQKKKGKKPEKV